jgi:hypothetical protein
MSENYADIDQAVEKGGLHAGVALALHRENKQLREDVVRMRELEEAFAKTTKGKITVSRYEHGGGRMFVDDGKNRDLIADTYNEGDREFIALCYEVFSQAALTQGKGGVHG